MKKSEWKRTTKEKVQNKIQERVEKEMENKPELRTVREDKWERKEYIATYDSDLVKDMWELLMRELKKELSKRRGGHEMPPMQAKGRHNRTCTRVSNSRNSIQNKG